MDIRDIQRAPCDGSDNKLKIIYNEKSLSKGLSITKCQLNIARGEI